MTLSASPQPPPEVFNAGEPPSITGSGGTVTLVDGSTFCLSDESGDIAPGTIGGFFYRDTRLISGWELRVDGQPAHPLAAVVSEAFTAQFVLRRPPRAGQADSTLLVLRERLVSDGLRETITLDNLGREATAVYLTMRVEADFADLFAVKEGRVGHGGAEATVAGDELLLRDQTDGTLRASIAATADPIVTPGLLTWHVVVPAQARWSTEIIVQPAVANRRVRPQFRTEEHNAPSEPARKLSAWRSASTVLTVEDPVFARVLRRTEDDLAALQIHDQSRGGRPFIAAGAPWFMTLFGRDSLLTAWMALPVDIGLAIGTLQTLAELQGRRVDPFTEEEPGRILHELRVGPQGAHVLGGNHYYGTADASPLFVMLLVECWRWGADEAVVRTLLPAADAAMSWIEQYGDRDGDGFVEYQRATDRGLINQGWKDSFDGINDAEGRIPSGPIALCEVQGYVYAARMARAELAEAFGDTATAHHHRQAANELRTRFAEAFWLPARGWYAVALDGAKKPVDALTSNTAHCLWSGIVPDEHAAPLIERLASDDMDSGFGLRTLSAAMGAYNPMSYHNGSVWPHDTAIAVAGLLRYAHLPGAITLARRLAAGLLDAAAAFGGRLPELFCGFPRTRFSPPVPYPTSCSPQAWATAAPLLLIRSFLGLQPHAPRRTLALTPQLPPGWGEITLNQLRLGPTTVNITARETSARVHGLPDSWRAEIHPPPTESEILRQDTATR